MYKNVYIWKKARHHLCIFTTCYESSRTFGREFLVGKFLKSLLELEAELHSEWHEAELHSEWQEAELH